MQILKAKQGKSVTIHHILNSTNSVCFVYDTGWTPSFDCYMLDSKKSSIIELMECIDEQMYVISSLDKHFDYLVVYTNDEEDEIQNIIQWLGENSSKFNVVEILVTCK